MEVNEKNDVYSFGVLLLEVIMGRHPGDFVSSISTIALSTPSSSSSFTNKSNILLNDLLDKRLSLPTDEAAEQVVVGMKVAIACLHPSPKFRPNMQQVCVQLMKDWKPFQSSLHNLTLGQALNVKF